MKKILISLLLVVNLLLTKASPVFATTIFSDSFTGADGTSLTSHNPSYSNLSSSFQISSNTIRSTSGTATVKYDGYTITGDFGAKIDAKATSSNWHSMIYFNYIDSNNFYSCYREWGGSGNPWIWLYKMVGGTSTNLATAYVANNLNTYETLRVERHGNTLECSLGNTTVSATDSSLSGGKVGLRLGTTEAGFNLDNFEIYDFNPNANKITVSPSTITTTVGSPFAVTITTNSTSEPFNAAQATVSVSSNLVINSISTPNADACNFNYTKIPTTGDPSFAGAIFGSSSSSCNVYTMIVTPIATGSSSINLTNASIRAYTNSAEILTDIEDGAYTINAATPSPTPNPLTQLTITSPYKTYGTNFNLTGGKDAGISSVYINSSTDGLSFPTNISWLKSVILSLGANNYTIYGRDDQAQQTATQTITIQRHTLGDINGDGLINLIDASLFAIDWNKTGNLSDPLSDMNNDGVVNLADFSVLAKLQ